jgi:hypothetical protein
MITADESVFPNNVVELLEISFQGIDPDLTVLKRPLRPSDPNQCIGVFPALWQPEEDSLEMGHSAPHEPTLAQYQIGIQAFVKDGDEIRGLAIHSILSKRVRGVLYRDQALRVALQSLYVSDGVSTESLRRWGVRTQRYMNNDIDGKFVYVSTLDYWIETEVQ